MRIWTASLAAVVVQPLVFAARLAPDHAAWQQALHSVGLVLLSVVVVAAASVLLVGIPGFLLLRKFQRLNWISLALAGFLAGTLPLAVLGWPRRLEGFSAGVNWHGQYVDTYIDGLPTTHAWLMFGEQILLFGLHGVIGALVFYAVWRRSSKHSCQV